MTARCDDCHKPISDPVSLHYRLGRCCREKRGIKPRRPIRLRTPGRIRRADPGPDQTDLLDQETP